MLIIKKFLQKVSGDPIALQKLREEVEKAKIELSSSDQVFSSCSYLVMDYFFALD